MRLTHLVVLPAVFLLSSSFIFAQEYCGNCDSNAAVSVPYSLLSPASFFAPRGLFGSFFCPQQTTYTPPAYYYEKGTTEVLFDGTDLSHWTKVDGSDPEGWSIEDGILTHAEGGADLFTKEEYSSFIFEFEFMVKKGEITNSGVKYKTWNSNDWAMGCEYQILEDGGASDAGSLHMTASLYDVYPPMVQEGLLKYDEFNQGKIVVMGNTIEHWLNGVRTVAAQIDSPDWIYRVSKSKFKNEPNFGHLETTRLFLQNHSTKVWFRNIKITELKPVTDMISSDCGCSN